MKIEELLTQVIEGQRTILNVSPDGKSVEFVLRRELPPEPREPRRAESQRRGHTFYEAATFAEYVARYGKEGDVVVYVDPASETAWAVLEERAARGVEVLTLKPQAHPLWAPWEELCKQGAVGIDQFREHLNHHRRAVVNPPGKALALMLAQIRGAVEVTIQTGKGRDSLNGIMVKSNVQGTDTKEFVDLPEEITLRVPLYVGGEVQDVNLDLVLEASAGGGVTVEISAGDVREAKILAFDSMRAEIAKILEPVNARVTYGKPAREPWAYLPEPKA